MKEEGEEEVLFQVSEQQKVATSSFLLQSSLCHNLSRFSNFWYQEQHHNSS
jgi:hypothetical protein